MAGLMLTAETTPPDCVIDKKAGVNDSKSETSDSSLGSAGIRPLNSPPLFKQLVFVRYLDHVLYSRSFALAMKPQTREAVGWLVYECELYVTVVWDRDGDPPTLRGGDPKASGLVLLRTDILELKRLKVHVVPLKENSECHINSPQTTIRDEYALQTKKRKTHGAKNSTRADKE